MNPPLRLAAFIGGGGRTLLNLADAIDRGELPAEIALVFASRANIAGVERARARGLPPIIINELGIHADDALHDEITARLVEAKIDLVCLCGYLRLFRVDPPFRGKVLNIHPALLPDFGGTGMYGERVHQAVLDSGREVSGCTVHIVDDLYDHGPIVVQRQCPILPGDTPQSLAARVFKEECKAYPQAIRLFAENRVQWETGRVTILPAAT